MYPKTLKGVINVMRQMPAKQKKPSPKQEKVKEKPKDETLVAILATNTSKKKDEGDYACFCCGDKSCRLRSCMKKNSLRVKEWSNPDMAPTYLVKQDKKRVRSSQGTEQVTIILLPILRACASS